ncbi:hypothetical protein FRC04_012266 [Tulasnella sp. 424]|nr:hypothetical protein FRC04_012266 [Tulasnella sp. 424]KAG8970908.1 hypothetical protein FRC05_011676 [Tulasnella sp. 425]
MSDPSTTESLVASATSAVAEATTSAAADLKSNGSLKIVGVILAISSGVLIGSSFVFKKKGLLQSQAGGPAGEGVAYLKSWLWWTGMTMMILGELCNFAAYAFVDAIVVTPLGALSVVICAILSSMFLKETLTFFGWIGCFLSIVGSIIIALNGPQEQAVSTIKEFQHLFFAPGFLVFGSVLIIGSLVIIFFFAPKYGKQNMIWYIAVCSMIGGLSVSCIQGIGAAIVTSIRGENQFKQWFTYFLLVFVTVTLVTEIYYLNVALALFNTAMVTPTYYVIFTACTLITSVVLYQGLKSTAMQIITVVMGFLVICAGIIILQMSKVDPEQLGKLDRKSTILLKAAQQEVQTSEKGGITSLEDPGMDALRGSFGTVGSIIRARSAKRLSMSSRGSQYRPRVQSDLEANNNVADHRSNRLSTQGLEHLPRHQLYDAPVRPSVDLRNSTQSIDEEESVRTPLAQKDNLPGPPVPDKGKSPRMQSIKFGTEDVAHYYPTAGRGQAIHEQRAGRGPSSQFQQRLPSQSEFDETRFSTPKVVTPPAQTTAYGSRGAGASYINPFNTPPDDHPLSQVESRSSTIMTSLSNDQSIVSLASTTGADKRDSLDPYDSPPEAAFRPGRRYPSSRGSDDLEESQRLVGRARGRDSPDSQDSVPTPDQDLRPGQIRLLPSLPKMNQS